MSTQVTFTLDICTTDDNGSANTTVTATENVPSNIDPRIYLRDRILREFGMSVQQPATAADVNAGKVENA